MMYYDPYSNDPKLQSEDGQDDDGNTVTTVDDPLDEIRDYRGYRGPCFWKLFWTSSDTTRVVEPQHYLTSIAELLFLTICCSFVITFVYSKITGANILEDNPIHNMVGYNNPCAFWDQPPALYFASAMFCPMVYFAIRYAIMDSQRADLDYKTHLKRDCDFLTRRQTELYSRRMGRACRMINFCYAFSQVFVMGIFVITPMVHNPENGPVTEEDVKNMHWQMRLHSACFLQLVPVLCITISANYFEAYFNGDPVPPHRWAVLAFYILATLLETVCAIYAIFWYEGNYQYENREQFYKLPPWFMCMVDYTWFISLPLGASFQPPTPDVIIQISLDEPGIDVESPVGVQFDFDDDEGLTS